MDTRTLKNENTRHVCGFKFGALVKNKGLYCKAQYALFCRGRISGAEPDEQARARGAKVERLISPNSSQDIISHDMINRLFLFSSWTTIIGEWWSAMADLFAFGQKWRVPWKLTELLTNPSPLDLIYPGKSTHRQLYTLLTLRKSPLQVRCTLHSSTSL